jgi:hypothetical protein
MLINAYITFNSEMISRLTSQGMYSVTNLAYAFVGAPATLAGGIQFCYAFEWLIKICNLRNTRQGMRK